MSKSSLLVEPLNEKHDRSAFSCGKEPLDRYIQKLASQHMKKGISQIFVAAPNHVVVGYYALSSLSIDFEELPERTRKKLPTHPIPCALIGRLAIDSTQQGTGLGKMLLMDACARIVGASYSLGIFAIVVDAKDASATQFYQHYGFMPLPDHPHRLFLPLETFRREFAR